MMTFLHPRNNAALLLYSALTLSQSFGYTSNSVQYKSSSNVLYSSYLDSLNVGFTSSPVQQKSSSSVLYSSYLESLNSPYQDESNSTEKESTTESSTTAPYFTTNATDPTYLSTTATTESTTTTGATTEPTTNTAPTTEPPTNTASSNSDVKMSRSELKTKFLTLISSTDRGQLASSFEKEKASELLSDLASLTPITNTVGSSEATGTWELIYSDTQLFRSSPFFMAGRAVCKDGEEAERYDWFCDMHRAALAISTIGKVRQIVSKDKLVSEFEVKVGSIPFLRDFTPFAYSGGWPVTIEGAIVSSASIEPSSYEPKVEDNTESCTCYDLFMDKVQIKGSNIPFLRGILDSPRVQLESRKLGNFLETTFPDQYTNPKPVFETIYLDEDGIRVSRDQDGKLFVYKKVSESETETDYENVMADLGITKLLEGFNDKILKLYL